MNGKSRVPCVSYAERLEKQAQMTLTGNIQTVTNSVIKYFLDNCKEIILCPPQELHSKAATYLKMLRSGCSNNNEVIGVNKYCSDAFTRLYDSFNHIQGYKTLEMMNVKSCPFCNRQFIITNSEAGVRPDFDHFLPKSKYPVLAVSFYNLIPICSTCNKKKGNKRIRINPYVERLNVSFSVHKKDDSSVSSLAELSKLKESELFVSLQHNSRKSKNSISVLGLEPVYNSHRYYVESLISKIYAYDRHARAALVNDFLSDGSTEKDVLDFVWGPYFERSKQEEMPLSKLTADLLNQFGIIPRE